MPARFQTIPFPFGGLDSGAGAIRLVFRQNRVPPDSLNSTNKTHKFNKNGLLLRFKSYEFLSSKKR